MPIACPSEEVLARMLDDLLVGAEAKAVESHVATCQECQRTLERLTLGKSQKSGSSRGQSPATEEFGVGSLRDRHGPGRTRQDLAAETQELIPIGWPTATSSERAGFPEIPGYQIERELGRGGMGVVYLARQVHANRLVALKMVLSNRGRPEDLLRFLIEGESLARLQHPHVVQVHEVGESEGRPYFSMEYVEGGTLADRLAEIPAPTPREAASVVEMIARAVHAAHQSGVVHRDLKPTNILLASKPKSGARAGSSSFWADPRPANPKVTDFGLAKHVGIDSGLTQTGQILGTPSYMAPEQATGGAIVGIPADVYALGAILYEALAGQPPFKGASAWETMMQVVHEPIVPPSRRHAGLPRDLEVICLKCLKKDPADRYPSADALAEDLRRFRAGEPILARPIGAIRVGAMWCRRHPAYATMAGLLVASIVIGTVGVVIQWRRAEIHLAASRRRLDLAMRSISAFYDGVSRDVFLKQPEMIGLRTELLRTPLEFYRGLRKELETGAEGDRPARLQLTDALINLGRLAQELDIQDEAEADFRQASGVARVLVAEDPDDRASLRLLAWSRANAGKIAAIAARFTEARAALGEADALFERLGREGPEDPSDADGRGFCRHFLGDVACDEGHFDESEGYYKGSIAFRRELVERRAGDVAAYLDQLGGTANNLGAMYGRSRRLREAERAFRDSVEFRRRLTEKVPGSTPHRASLASSLSNLGESCYDQQHDGEALTHIERSLAIQEQIVAQHAAVARYRADLAATHYRLGQLHQATGFRSRARADFARAADEMGRLSDVDPTVMIWREDRATFLFNLGDNLEEDGLRSEAAGAYARSLAALDRPPVVKTAQGRKIHAALLARQGASDRKAGRHGAAEAAFDSALAATGGREAGPDSREEIAKVLRLLAGWQLLRREPGWLPLALADSRRASTVLGASTDDGSRVGRTDAIAHSARALAGLGRIDEAFAECDRAETSAGDDALAGLVASATRAEVLARAGRLDEAIAKAEESESTVGNAISAIRVARAFALAAGSPPAEGPGLRAEKWLARAATDPGGEARSLLRELESPAFDGLRDRPGFRSAALDLAFPADPFAD